MTIHVIGKHLAQRTLNEFPAATDEKVKELVPVKSNSSCMKLILHSCETVGVYVVDSVPVMIKIGDVLVPTVCALWKVPDLLPTLIIHSPVLPKLAGSAPLYAPGVTLGDPVKFPCFSCGSLIAAATVDNCAAGAVGRADISSSDLLRTNIIGFRRHSYHRKGTALSAANVRSILTEHVKTRGLNSTQQRGAVALDPLLAKITGQQEQAT
ncbi:unnamed protein product [Parnassius apollo]|uniref:(apollo) hypothetical protein n=1 Tax=Parnassius apollo TaxID=110799 RepID=A0A8S3W5H6_PARAO|nr:unnamed protein product [Parnassius apollo]